MATDGNPYTVPTGVGFVGVYMTTGYSVSIPIGVLTCVAWRSDDSVVAVGDDTAVALVDADSDVAVAAHEGDREWFGPANVRQTAVGTAVSVPPDALRWLPSFAGGDQIRVYDRARHRADATTGLLVVPRDPDPFVEGGERDGE